MTARMVPATPISSHGIWAIVINWRQPKASYEALASLEASSEPPNVIVVDNESTEDFVDQVHERFPAIVVLPQPKNLGFAAAANLGIRHALDHRARAVFLLNNDAVVAPTAVHELAVRLQALSRPGIVTAKVFLSEAPDRLWAVGGDFTGRRVISLGAGELDVGAYDARPLDFVYGCALLLDAEMLRAIGLFDERFFLYYEDIDLCLRARRAGYDLAMAPRAHVWHEGSRSTRAVPKAKAYHHARSRVLFFARHVPSDQRAAFVASEIRFATRQVIEHLAKAQPRQALAYLCGMRDGWRTWRTGGGVAPGASPFLSSPRCR